MRVLLNGLISLLPKSGIGHYIDSLHEQLAADGREVVLFPNGFARRLAKGLVRLAPARPNGNGASISLLSPRRWLRGTLRLARRISDQMMRNHFRRVAHTCQLYHEPNYIPFESDRPTVVTVHDLSVLRHPEWHPADRVRNFERAFVSGLQRSRQIITDSHAIRREIIDVIGLPDERVSAVHLGVRPAFRPMSEESTLTALRQWDLQPGYLLHVGTIEPRKNLLMLMRAYVDLPRELRERHPLVLIGGWGWQNDEIRGYYETAGRHYGVRHIGYAPEELLPAIYNGARCLVFPSHYEGFGFPPLEMLACGGAVLASNTASIAEIMPPGMNLLSPNDSIAWRESMRWVMRDEDYLNNLRRGGPAHAGRFTWRECARQTWDVYRRALEVPTPAEREVRRAA